MNRFRPLGDRILVEFDPSEDEERLIREGLLVAPAKAVEDVFQWGTVLAVGPGRWNKKKTSRIPVDVKVGDLVLYIRYLKETHTGKGLRQTGGLEKDQFIIQEKDIVAVAEKEDGATELSN